MYWFWTENDSWIYLILASFTDSKVLEQITDAAKWVKEEKNSFPSITFFGSNLLITACFAGQLIQQSSYFVSLIVQLISHRHVAQLRQTWRLEKITTWKPEHVTTCICQLYMYEQVLISLLHGLKIIFNKQERKLYFYSNTF